MVNAEAEQTIRVILSKYLGDAAYTIDRGDHIWRQFPDDNSKWLSKKQEQFSAEISSVFKTILSEADWEDASSIDALTEILVSGKLGADKKLRNLNMNIAASKRGLKFATALLLPLAVVLMFFSTQIGLLLLYLYFSTVGVNYLLIRGYKKQIEQQKNNIER